MLDGEDLGIQAGDSLLAFLGHAQIAQTVLNIAADHIPEKGGIILAEVVGGGKSQVRIHTGFCKFVK